MPEKVKIEIVNDDGTKIKIEIPSNDPDLIYTYLKMFQSVQHIKMNDSQLEDHNLSNIMGKVEDLIKSEFGLAIFTLSDIYKLYKLKFEDEISKSTLSTYLNRLVEYGMLHREGRRGRYKYRMKYGNLKI